MCLLKRVLSEEADYDEVSLFCKAKIKNNQCRYYNKLLYDYVPYQDTPLLYSEILNFAENMKSVHIIINYHKYMMQMLYLLIIIISSMNK